MFQGLAPFPFDFDWRTRLYEMGVWSPFLSGVFGASGSLMGKLAFDARSETFITNYICTFTRLCLWSEHVTKVICLLGMLGFNAMMISYLFTSVKALGSVKATTISSATGFCMSSLYGHFFFQERLSIDWILAMIMIIVGVYLLLTDSPKSREKVQ